MCCGKHTTVDENSLFRSDQMSREIPFRGYFRLRREKEFRATFSREENMKRQIRQFFLVRELLKNQWLKTSQIQDIQQKKLHKLLHHAYTNVPYYRQLFDSVGVKPGDIQTVSDLSVLPITTKSTLRELPLNQITAQNIDLKTCIKDRTSGSTGMPLNFFFTRDDMDIRSPVEIRMLASVGYKATDSTLAIIDDRHLGTTYWFQRLGILRREYISILSPVEEHIKRIQTMKPDIIWTLTSNIVLIASRMQADNIRVTRPKAIYTIGEFLDPNRRRLIASVFGVAPLDQYSSTECGGIAWECSARMGYHINIDTVVVECINNGKHVQSGESGELIVTNLHSYAMPFIRYSVGDRGILSDKMCSCGRNLPLMMAIEGRSVDFIVLENGKRISPYLLTCAIEDIPGIVRYQIIQEAAKQITVNFIKGDGFSPETLRKIQTQCQGVVGKDVEIKPVVVESLVHDKSGKFRVVISKLATN
ncbi:CapK related-protein [Candidatus Vecturithrix granuli]|uniref:CapK related-protein n=1 Tax=Vecturithrix granuli TaxID=1499967 RepID=A0A081BX29_VECG1|nr:CapK related-protein [Candidatus Vecturithrix granuli]